MAPPGGQTYETGLGEEVAYRDRNLLDDVFADDVDVVLQLSGDGDDGSSLSYRT